jgi:hypothetical protein
MAFILPYSDATVMRDHPVLYETTVYEQAAAHSPRPSASTLSYLSFVPLSSQVILHARVRVFRRHRSVVFNTLLLRSTVLFHHAHDACMRESSCTT